MSDPVDPIRLSKTLAYLLRHRPDAGDLSLDEEGWTDLGEAARAVSGLMGVAIDPPAILAMLDDARTQRFEVAGETARIRAVADRRPSSSHPPDILYHAVTYKILERARRDGQLRSTSKDPLMLSTDESAAWRLVHRRRDEGTVIYVDSTRARRHGARFRHAHDDLFRADRIPLIDALNLQKNFAEQLSAGGIPIANGDDGLPRVALIRVARRSGVTWEVAKGKLEPGEHPEAAAVREVQEEMGITTDLEITDYVGVIRYGFLAPGGLPRLKTVYLYLMKPSESGLLSFSPRAEEGIGDVRWFTPREACQAVTHSSLRPLMHQACSGLLQ